MHATVDFLTLSLCVQGELKHRVAVLAAEILINRIVDSIRTPPYSLEPVPTSETVCSCMLFVYLHLHCLSLI